MRAWFTPSTLQDYLASWRDRVAPRAWLWAATLLMGAVFALDLVVERGVAAAVPYGVVVLLAYLGGRSETVWTFAALCTVLTLVGLGFSDAGGESWKVFANRGLAIVIIWTITLLCLHTRRLAVEYQASAAMREELEREVALRTAELVSANESVIERNRELRQFASVASHDLKTPLRGIANFAQFLEMEYSDRLDDEARDYIQHIVDGVQRMQQLIDDLLQYARLESPAESIGPVDLEEVLTRVTALLESEIEEAAAEVTHAPLPTVLADSSRMTQLLLNLIQNGIKYRKEEVPRIHVAVGRTRDHWTLSVRDNGIGIEERFHERVFEVFRRLHTEDEYSGTGIGLASCRRIVTQAGGRIWLTSTPGRGSTFYVELPHHEPPPSAAASSPGEDELASAAS